MGQTMGTFSSLSINQRTGKGLLRQPFFMLQK